MRLHFKGTKGEIEEIGPKRKKNSYVVLTYENKNYALDFGYDWKPTQLKTDDIVAIWLSHLHPDHADGLADADIDIPVYIARRSWEKYRKPKEQFKFKPNLVGGKFKFDAIPAFEFPIFHSIIAPASGVIFTLNKLKLAYVPDVLSIKNRREIMKGVNIVIYDSASIKRPIVRRKDTEVYGHASMQTELRWAKIDEVPEVIFTHFGVDGIKLTAQQFNKRLEIPPGVKVNYAYDSFQKEY